MGLRPEGVSVGEVCVWEAGLTDGVLSDGVEDGDMEKVEVGVGE